LSNQRFLVFIAHVSYCVGGKPEVISAPTASPVEARLSDLEIELAAPEDVGEALELESRPDVEGMDDLEDTPTQYVVDAMGQFLGGVSRYPLLTSHEELRLAQRIERGDLMAKDRLAAPRVTTSLDKAVGSDAEMTLGSLLPADGPEIGEELHLDFQRDRVLDAVATIEEPGQSVIRLRFGLDGEGETKSYAAIGRELELDPEGVRRIEHRVLAQLALHRDIEALHAA
jgi:DNA-directed RNA polymerase sigma subunit (sigma70/sigma32)